MERLKSDEEIIEMYWQKNENAIKETDRKYGKYLFSIARNIVHDRGDCEECLNDTYIGVWNSIPPQRPNAFKAFITVIARRVCVNRYRKNAGKKKVPSGMTVALSELEDILPTAYGSNYGSDTLNLGEVISEYLGTLSKRRKYIFMSRYYMAEAIDDIAYDLGVSRSTVNKELAAIRTGLKEKLEGEGYTV